MYIFVCNMQADSTAGFFRSLLHLIKTFEDMFLVFVYDTLSVVCHTDACIVIFAIKMYIDFSFIRSVFEGIGQQVVHYFFYFNRIEGHVQVFYFAHETEADGMVKSILLKSTANLADKVDNISRFVMSCLGSYIQFPEIKQRVYRCK